LSEAPVTGTAFEIFLPANGDVGATDAVGLG
jgi:hypothetical protein